LAERTNAERHWEPARQEQQGRREPGEAFRTEGRGREGYREGSFGGGYQPSNYEQTGGRGGSGGGWQSAGPSDYVEGGYYGQGERGYGRPAGFRYQGPGYGAGSGYNAEPESVEWGGRPGGEFRPGSFGVRGREAGGGRGGQWGAPWREGTTGWGGERGPFGGGGWRNEGTWEQDRDFGDDGGWGGGAGFRGGYGGGGFTPQPRSGGYARWQGGEGSWRGSGAPGYPGGFAGESWGEQGRGGGYGQGMRPGWSGGQSEGEGGRWGGQGQREWGEPGRGMTGGAAGYGDPWTIPGPFTGRGPEGYQRSEDSIRDDVCERLTRHGHLDASGIRVRIDNNNEVVLEGTVPDRHTKRLAEDVAESVFGVRDVQNRLRVSERDENRGTGTARGEERDNRERGEPAQQGSRGGGRDSDGSRTGGPERDVERQKAPGRSKT
jgi:hypothetical protein